MSTGNKIKVLIVDDSAVVRRILSDCLASEKDIEVVGTAPDPYIARDRIVELRPDVVTLDIEMPRMDGLTFLGKMMQYYPLPVIIISSLAKSSTEIAVEALRIGAVDVLGKPSGGSSVGELRNMLADRIRRASTHVVAARGPVTQPASTAKAAPVASAPTVVAAPLAFSPSEIVAIGASTGGVGALQEVLIRLPAEMPPIVVAQHIPAGFSKALADRLNQICRVSVKEAQDGDTLGPGQVCIAPGDRHMTLLRGASGYQVAVRNGPQVCFQRPSVDVLFHSVATAAGAHATGVIMTGMGADGAEGLLAMRQAGARTIAQDEASCVVFGMPKEAIQRGAAAEVQPLNKMADAIVTAINKKSRAC